MRIFLAVVLITWPFVLFVRVLLWDSPWKEVLQILAAIVIVIIGIASVALGARLLKL